MVIGQTDNHRIYLVSGDKPSPTSSSDYKDYSEFFIEWKIKYKMNGLSVFEGEACDIVGTRRNKIVAGSYLYVMSGTKIISKFIINKPIYDDRGKVTITGVQSSGTEIVRKNLVQTNTGTGKYEDETLNNIFTRTSSEPYGLCTDNSGNLIINNGIEDGNDRISMATDYNNRIQAITKMCSIAKREWTINHGVNIGSTPYDIDTITAMKREGSATSVKTFYLSGPNQNVINSSGTEETDTAANHIIVEGRDINGKQVETELADVSRRYKTELAQTLDGWLYEDLSATAMTMKVKKGHGFTGLVDFYIKIDNEVIWCWRVTSTANPNYDEIQIDTRGTKTWVGMINDTVPANHKSGSDVILIDDGRNFGGTSYVRVYVNNYTALPSVGYIKVGSEILVLFNNTGTYLRCLRIGAGFITTETWDASYAHSAGASVYDNAYTTDNPDTDSNSIYTNGLISKKVTDNLALNKDALDKKAQQLLISKQNPVKRISIEIYNPLEVWNDINLGDTITIQESDDIINIPDGDYRIMEYEYSWPPGKLILYLNDTTVRGYSAGSFDFAESFDEAADEKRQEPTRSMDDQRKKLAEDIGDPSGFAFGSGKIDNVVVPSNAWGALDPASYLTTPEDNMAANVGFVKGWAGGGGGGGLWSENISSNYIFPTTAGRNVVPNGNAWLGTSTYYWQRLYVESILHTGSINISADNNISILALLGNASLTADQIVQIMSANDDILVDADDDINIDAGDDIDINADDDVSIYAYNILDMHATNQFAQLAADDDELYLYSYEDMYITVYNSGNDLNVDVGDDIWIDCGGDFDVTAGGSKNCVLQTTKGTVRLAAIESPEVWFEEKISSKLEKGIKTIELDKTFLECIHVDADNPLHVIATPTDNCNGLWVEKKEKEIIVHELKNGKSNATFDVTISAKRKDLQGRRFDLQMIKPKRFNNQAIQSYAVIKEVN